MDTAFNIANKKDQLERDPDFMKLINEVSIQEFDEAIFNGMNDVYNNDINVPRNAANIFDRPKFWQHVKQEQKRLKDENPNIHYKENIGKKYFLDYIE